MAGALLAGFRRELGDGNTPVNVGGTAWKDGGVVDRLMVEPWLRWRGERPAILHVVARSAGKDSPVPLDRWVVVRTPKSGASFWSLGDIPAKIEEARAAAAPVLAGMGRGGLTAEGKSVDPGSGHPSSA